MADVFKNCPVLENERYFLRLIVEKDAQDLLEVYRDKNALPFFNSDNCNGDNFYYPTLERMLEAVRFWIFSYENRYFVRLTVIDKAIGKAIGTIELFHRDSDDAFDNAGVLRLDVRSDYEREDALFEILSLVIPSAFDLYYCDQVIMKAPLYAVERIRAIQKYGFTKSEEFMIGSEDGRPYGDYWTLKK